MINCGLIIEAGAIIGSLLAHLHDVLIRYLGEVIVGCILIACIRGRIVFT